MSKMYKRYLELKQENSSNIYLFKSGIFYVFLQEDAKLMSSILNLRLTNLNECVLKCGFPVNNLKKYLDLTKNLGYEINIVDSLVDKPIPTFMISISMLLGITVFMLKNINSLINLYICLSHMYIKLDVNFKIGDVAFSYILMLTLLYVLVVTLFTLTISFKNHIIVAEVIILKIKRPTYTEFICTNCKCHEKIPTKIVLQMDMMDPGDPIYPPMFNCEKCGGLMKPVYFIGYTGIEYTYDGN